MWPPGLGPSIATLDRTPLFAYPSALHFRPIIGRNTMSRRCELTGTDRQIGHRVSHSNIKTKREFGPNLVSVTLRSEALGRSFKFKITAATLRTVDHRGGFDAFLIKQGEDGMCAKAVKVRRELKKRLAEQAAA